MTTGCYCSQDWVSQQSQPGPEARMVPEELLAPCSKLGKAGTDSNSRIIIIIIIVSSSSSRADRFISREKPRQELKVSTETETMGEFCLLPVAPPASSLYNQDHLPGGGTTHSGLGSLTLINNQENIPHTCYRPILWCFVLFFSQQRFPLCRGFKLISGQKLSSASAN